MRWFAALAAPCTVAPTPVWDTTVHVENEHRASRDSLGWTIAEAGEGHTIVVGPGRNRFTYGDGSLDQKYVIPGAGVGSPS